MMLPTHFARSTKTLFAIGLLVPLLLIGIPSLLALHAEARVKSSFTWVTHTLEVQGAVQALLSSLIDSETGQRGFLLTQRSNYLEPYDSARARIERQLHDLRTLTADNAEQQARIAELEPLVSRRLDLAADSIARERSGDHAGAVALVNSDLGIEAMNKIRGLLQSMAGDEQRLLWLRQQALTKQTGRSTDVLAVLIAAGALCAGLVLYLLRRISQLEPVVTICANSRTIEYGDEWLSFEEYLQRRFNVTAIEGLSPDEFEKARAADSRYREWMRGAMR